MQLEIKTTIDAFNPIQVKALNDFLTTIGANSDLAVHSEIYVPLGEKPKLTRKKAEKVETPSDEAVEKAIQEIKTLAESEEVAKIEAVEPETVIAPTLMQIRSLVAQKAGEHKDAIKSKLVDLGAQNVSTLDAKHFQTIFDFLTEL